MQKTRQTVFRKNVIAVNGKSFVTEDAKKTGLFRVYLVKKSINYLCKGYKHFFEHTASAMQFMKNEILNRRPPSNIMRSGILNNQESTI